MLVPCTPLEESAAEAAVVTEAEVIHSPSSAKPSSVEGELQDVMPAGRAPQGSPPAVSREGTPPTAAGSPGHPLSPNGLTPLLQGGDFQAAGTLCGTTGKHSWELVARPLSASELADVLTEASRFAADWRELRAVTQHRLAGRILTPSLEVHCCASLSPLSGGCSGRYEDELE
jgi:hypothetical protein